MTPIHRGGTDFIAIGSRDAHHPPASREALLTSYHCKERGCPVRHQLRDKRN